MNKTIIFIILILLFFPNTNATTYTSRPDAEKLIKDFRSTAQYKIPLYEPETAVLPKAATQGSQWIYFENQNYNRKKTLIVLQSGIHGIETYAGSYLQQIFLKDYFEQYWTKGHSILIIHALNGWGLLNNRRFTQAGVDLNRNFDTDKTLFKTKNEKYEYARNIFLNSEKVLHPSIDLFMIKLNLIYNHLKEKYFGVFTTKDFRDAVSNGQYEFPKEIGYGGKKFEPQVIWAQKQLPKIFSKFRKILVYDFHTGLGEKNELHLILSGDENEDEQNKIFQLFEKGLNQKSYKVTPVTSEGFYSTHGDYLSFVRKMNKHAKTIALSAEFGTVGTSTFEQIDTISRMILENQGYWQGYANDDARKETQEILLDLFAPNQESWWKSVDKKGRALFDDSLEILEKDW